MGAGARDPNQRDARKSGLLVFIPSCFDINHREHNEDGISGESCEQVEGGVEVGSTHGQP